MQLTQGQIEKLFEFVSKKWVHWYDVQIEIVDHLAAAIEEKMNENPNLNFDEALQKVYSGFGIFGFAQIVREKENQTRRQTNRAWWKEIKNLFNWPNVLQTSVIAVLFYLLYQFVPIGYVVCIILLALLIINIYTFRIFKKMRVKKKPLLLASYTPYSSFPAFLFFQFALHTELLNFNSIIHSPKLIFGFTVLFIGTIAMIAAFKVSVAILHKSQNDFPEAFA